MNKSSLIIDAVLSEARVAYWDYELRDIPVSAWQVLNAALKDYPESEQLIQPNANPAEAQKFKQFIADEVKRRYDLAARKKKPDFEGIEREKVLREVEIALKDYHRKNKLKSKNVGYKELQSYKDLLAKGFRDTTSHQQELNGTIEFTVTDVYEVEWKYFYNDTVIKKVNPNTYSKIRRQIAVVDSLDVAFNTIAKDLEKHNQRKEFHRKKRWEM